MDSNASHTTTTKIATPAENAPGAGIMCGIVFVVSVASLPEGTSRLGNQPRADADFRFEQLRNGAARLRVFHGRIELRLVRAGNVGDQVQMALRDGKSIRQLLQRNRRGGLQLARGHTR